MKAKELIAVGISVVINCESCMQWRIEHAALAGAVEREVPEAIEVGIGMGGGPATANARFALRVMAAMYGPHGQDRPLVSVWSGHPFSHPFPRRTARDR